MAARVLPPINLLRECFSYEPDTGALFWRVRPLHHFNSASKQHGWNVRKAGKRAEIRYGEGNDYLDVRVNYRGQTTTWRAHRVIVAMMTGRQDFELVDHINREKADNRWANLRIVSASENMQNRESWKVNGLPKGVSFVGGHSRFKATATMEGRTVHIGTYDTPRQAHSAYCEFVGPHYGVFFDPGPDVPSVFD